MPRPSGSERYIHLEVTWGCYIEGMKRYVMFDTVENIIVEDIEEDIEEVLITSGPIPSVGASPIDDGWV